MVSAKLLAFVFLSLMIGTITAASPYFGSFSLPKAKPSDPAYQTLGKDFLQVYSAERATLKKHPPQKVHERFAAKNKAFLQAVQSQPREKTGLHSLTKAQAAEILASTRNHPVVSHQAARKYDTPKQQIGFCFGTAAYVHWELMRRGVNPKSIAKVFALGDFSHKNRLWDFHMTTIVQAKEGGWWVIDQLQTEVLSLEEWTQKILLWSEVPSESRFRFYLAHPAKFNALPGAYQEEKIYSPIYKGYFKDLVAWFSSAPAAGAWAQADLQNSQKQ